MSSPELIELSSEDEFKPKEKEEEYKPPKQLEKESREQEGDLEDDNSVVRMYNSRGNSREDDMILLTLISIYLRIVRV